MKTPGGGPFLTLGGVLIATHEAGRVPGVKLNPINASGSTDWRSEEDDRQAAT